MTEQHVEKRSHHGEREKREHNREYIKEKVECHIRLVVSDVAEQAEIVLHVTKRLANERINGVTGQLFFFGSKLLFLNSSGS